MAADQGRPARPAWDHRRGGLTCGTMSLPSAEARGPHTERELVDWLIRRIGIAATREFLSHFGNYRIPKRSRHLIHRVRQRAIMAVAIRLVKQDAVLSRQVAEAVGAEVALPAKEVQGIWGAFRRKGKEKVDGGSSTEVATGPDVLSR